jgi:NAD(P)-dependent dehydrogenase (short-subunit alcohol dehydrogenase family)
MISPHPAYKISKVALNSLTVQYALELEKDGFAFVVVCPGVSLEITSFFLLL